MQDVASLKIAIQTGDVKTANSELDKLSNTAGKTEKATLGVTKSFFGFGTAIAGSAVAAAALLVPFVKLSDQMTGINSKLKLVTSSTQQLTSVQSELFKIAQTTRQGFAETVDTYSNFAVAMGEMGKSQKEILRVTETVNKAIAISGGTAQQAAAATMQLGQAFASGTLRGDELNSILENSKGLAQAIADGMGVPIGKLRTLGSEGKITADILASALEKSAKSVDDKFGKVGVTVDQSMTMAKNSLMLAVGEMDKATGISKTLGSSLQGLSGIFTDLANSVHSFNIEIKRLQDVRKINNFEDANTALKQIDDQIKALTTSTDLQDRASRVLKGDVQIRGELNNLYAARAALNKKVNVIAEEEVKIQEKANKTYKNRVIDKPKEKKAKKSDEQKEAEKASEEQRKRDKADSDFALQTAIEANQKRKELLDEEAKLQADSALAFYDLIKTDAEKVNEKFLSLYEKNKDLFSTDQLALFFDKWNKSLDDTFEKVKEMDFSASIEFDPQGLDGTAKAIAGIGKQLDELTKAEKQYQKNKKIAGATEEEIAKNEAEHTKDQITGYASLAGAMSSMFAQGSREAEAFKAVQSGLALINAVTAVMNAGTNGDGYTAVARMAAVAAYASQVLGSVGLALGSGGTSTSSDSFASQNANTGTGSVLGDATAQSESITKSMEILSDIAKPEFALISQMNKSLISIDQKMGGLSANILQSGGFAVGEGYAGQTVKGYGGEVANFLNDVTNFVANPIGGIPFVDNLLSGLINAGGNLVGSIVGGILGGGSKKSLQDAGISFSKQFLDAAIVGLEGKSYQVTKTVTDGGRFGKDRTSYNSYFSQLDEYTKTQFQLVLGNLRDITLMSGEALNTSASDVEDSLSSYVVNLGKISLLGKTGEEIETELNSVFGKIGDEIATKAFPALVPFQAIGEGLFETMTRVASGMEEADYYIGRLGQSFQDIKYTEITNQGGDVALEALRQSILNLEGTSSGVASIIDNLSGSVEDLYDTYTGLDKLRFSLTAIGTSTAGLTSSMLYGAGGITALDDATQSYIENYLTESEKVAYNTSVMTDAFTDIGLTIPTSKQGFTELLKSIDVTTESGQDLYGRLILLSEGFNELVDSSDKIKSSLFENIKSFIDSISGKGAIDAPKAFSDFSSSFNSMIDAIANGSGDLLEVGNTALDNAQNYLNVVTATATAGRDVEFAKAMLVNKFSGVIATPEMTLSNINSTLIQNNQTLVSELQSLKFELQSIKQMSITQTSTQIKTLYTQRALLGEMTA